MEWWRKSVVYQIYPKSFNDTNGSGEGDIDGIIEKLDYLNQLGVDIIWLTPIYRSPQVDNGYDISDYYTIHEEFGTMADFERLLKEAHKRELKIIMDIVVNHTSTEHSWFKQSAASKENPYRDFYIWKDPVNGQAPNNWQSKFGGSAWKYEVKTGQYYLHLFDETQADLNWENERVREDVYQMMTYWFEKGVDGFRLDVINLISKDQDIPDDDGSTAPGDGRKFYTDGPRAHEFMKEMNDQVFSKYDVMTVGEMSSTTIDHCIKYTKPERKELNMTFNFHHLKVDYPGGEKWSLADVDFQKLKDILSTWQIRMHEGGGWNALFWCNHDQPRIVSRYGDDQVFHNESAKMLATVIHLMQGTPFIYQGEEFGMTNPNFDRLTDYRDIETLNHYNILKEKGYSEDQVMEVIKARSRDNSRTPVQWNSGKNAGFTTGTPWLPAAPNYKEINAEAALSQKDSIFYHYKKLIQLRKEFDIITNGNYELLEPEHGSVFAYTRNTDDETLLVVNNFYGSETSFTWYPKTEISEKAEILISNYNDAPATITDISLRPYESFAALIKKRN
ncbi:alpha,alpha-phosphotrehalase [Alteribacillus sp. HJP-4]|uniref:alpha,alpha-phosphotrehalase n=1 Tax=Alteribacillus sp. HJP-4 TaxID=2775394 RepID=UPI0035CD1D58